MFAQLYISGFYHVNVMYLLCCLMLYYFVASVIFRLAV